MMMKRLRYAEVDKSTKDVSEIESRAVSKAQSGLGAKSIVLDHAHRYANQK